jgi:hypothetical protein
VVIIQKRATSTLRHADIAMMERRFITRILHKPKNRSCRTSDQIRFNKIMIRVKPRMSSSLVASLAIPARVRH